MNTAVLLSLFSQNQPYESALKVPCDVVLEAIRSKLDEGLSYLENDRPRLARKQIEIEKEYGSVAAFSKEAMKHKQAVPKIG